MLDFHVAYTEVMSHTRTRKHLLLLSLDLVQKNVFGTIKLVLRVL